MYIEDLLRILYLGSPPNINRFDRNVISSLDMQIFNGFLLTEKQAALCLKLVKKHQTYLEQKTGKNLDTAIQNPNWKKPFRVISQRKYMEVEEHTDFKKVVRVQFPYDEKIVKEIQTFKHLNNLAIWDKDSRSWIFPLQEQILVKLYQIYQDFDFLICDQLMILFKQIENIQQNIENLIPMLVYENYEPKIVNFPPNLPQIESKTLISALFEARKYGICVWDDYINDYIDSDDVLPITKQFLKTSPSEKFSINPEKIPIFDLRQIVKNLFPIIFVIPGGSELEKLSFALDFLKSIEVDTSNISVLFRLPSESDKKFNDFIKDQKLNNPLTEKTEVIFLSSKLPKTVLKLNKKINLLINLGHENVHYLMKIFIQNHENTIHYNIPGSQKSINFEYL